MHDPTTIEKRIPFVRNTQGRKPSQAGISEISPPPAPRIARMLALAIHFAQLLRTGQVLNPSQLARLGQVPPARISQIMALLSLAPEIQEQILFWEDYILTNTVTEKNLRSVAAYSDWNEQRKAWNVVFPATIPVIKSEAH